MQRRRLALVTSLALAVLVPGLAGCGGKPKKPVPDLIQQLKGPDEAVRIRAADSLASPPPSGDAIPALEQALKEDRSPYVRKAAAQALGAAGPAAQSAVASLEKAQADPDEGVRLAAKAALEKILGK
jgi:HEAT repeat protein